MSDNLFEPIDPFGGGSMQPKQSAPNASLEPKVQPAQPFPQSPYSLQYPNTGPSVAQPQWQPRPEASGGYRQPPKADTKLVALTLLLAFSVMVNMAMLAILMWPNPTPDDDDGDVVPGPDVQGVAFVLLEDENRNPRKEWSAKLAISFDSVADFGRNNAGKLPNGQTAFASYDVSQDESKIDPVFREVVKASTGKKPVVLILKDNKISEYEIREDTDEMLGTLEIAIE